MNTTCRRFILIDAAPEKVWQAFSESANVQQWLGTQSAVDFQPGGLWDMGAESLFAEYPRATISAIESGRSFAMQWPINGADTNLRIELEEQNGMTRVFLAHVNLNPPDVYRLHDKWRFSLFCLKTWLELGEVPTGFVLDSNSGDDTIHTMPVPVSAETAFAALSEPEKLDHWMSTGAEIDPRPGGRFSYGWAAGGPGDILEYEEGRHFSYKWQFSHEDIPTMVKWQVEGAGAQATIRLVHSGFVGKNNEALAYRFGWAAYMAGLYLYLRTGVDVRSISGAYDSECESDKKSAVIP